MLLVTTPRTHKSTSHIYLLNNRKEKSTSSTLPRAPRDQTSQEILVGIVFFFAFQKFTPQALLDPNPTSKARKKQSPLDLEYFILSHFTSNISGQQCMSPDAALARETCTLGLTKKLPRLDSSCSYKNNC